MRNYQIGGVAVVLASFLLTGCQLPGLRHSAARCCSNPYAADHAGTQACSTQACSTQSCGPQSCQTGRPSCLNGCAGCEVDPWCGYRPCQWRQRVLARTCDKQSVRYIQRATPQAVFGGHGIPGGIAAQSVAYYIPSARHQAPAAPQSAAPQSAASPFSPAATPRFEHAPAPVVQQVPHRAQPINSSDTRDFQPARATPPVAVKPPVNTLPAETQPPAAQLERPASEGSEKPAAAAPTIRPVVDPKDPTAPRNLIPGLKQ